jgi:hypothetical protein
MAVKIDTREAVPTHVAIAAGLGGKASVRLRCIVLARYFQPTRLPTSASHSNPTGFIQIPDFGDAIRGNCLDSHLLGFISRHRS